MHARDDDCDGNDMYSHIVCMLGNFVSSFCVNYHDTQMIIYLVNACII